MDLNNQAAKIIADTEIAREALQPERESLELEKQHFEMKQNAFTHKGNAVPTVRGVDDSSFNKSYESRFDKKSWRDSNLCHIDFCDFYAEASCFKYTKSIEVLQANDGVMFVNILA